MNEQLTVRPGPEAYRCNPGIIEVLKDYLIDRAFKRVLIVHGKTSWEKVESKVSLILNEADLKQIEEVTFEGECSYEEVARLKKIAETVKADVVIGIGGGKIMDTVKYVAAEVPSLHSILIPTLASNCAPWTSLSVMYSIDGEFIRYDFHHRQASLLLVDTEIILDSPVRYFAAGIGDTLAKWYESEPNLSLPGNDSAALMIARSVAAMCKDTIEKYGVQSVKDAENRNLTNAYTKIVETIIMTGGLVGGFGDELARTTAAHAIHDGLTFFPSVHHLLHGEKVAYGVMVQLVLNNKVDEISSVAELFQSLHLPVCLEDLGLDTTVELYEKLAWLSIEHDPGIHNLPYPISEGILAEAIRQNEYHIKRWKMSLSHLNS
ncbi:iron-containing alcohol dehydrogenase family protein [Alkalibacterium olivapovliticus]|uniref:Putative oxidoreductase n=1 Tax=Alkalibacterium olivapovliticus TaxID=99907 RepID=A0A2T0W8X5_9LACT|nr:iron-containing alcohol dehydrogenase family protein [Alkalibacterium olivapovliticus]PRY83149.1 putative oxidoreductase [Alkalibacterium olivapovliticus]